MLLLALNQWQDSVDLEAPHGKSNLFIIVHAYVSAPNDARLAVGRILVADLELIFVSSLFHWFWYIFPFHTKLSNMVSEILTNFWHFRGQWRVTSLRQSDVYMHQKTRPSLFPIMNCCLFSVKPCKITAILSWPQCVKWHDHKANTVTRTLIDMNWKQITQVCWLVVEPDCVCHRRLMFIITRVKSSAVTLTHCVLNCV